MLKLKFDVLLYIESGLSDNDLNFMDLFLPEELSGKLKGLDIVNDIYFSIPESYKGKLSEFKNCFIRKGNDDVEFWKDIFSVTKSDHIARLYADSAMLDISIIKEMIDIHLEYLTEFTYSENLPQGFSSEIISNELIKAIPEFHEKTLPLNKIIKSNINQFDIELFYKDPDIRDKRLSFLNRNPRDKRVMENICKIKKSVPSYVELRNIIEENPEALYIGPSYLEIELTGRCDLNCIFCYRNTLKEVHCDMDLNLFKKIIADMKSFDLPYTVCFGGSGEPQMNERFYEIMELAQNEALIERIIVETNGLYADSNYKNFLINSGSKINTIININGMNAETYKSMHGEDNFDKVLQNIISLKELNAQGEKIYIQIMKINETEPFLDKYYDFWENYKIPIILQKQNTFLNRIEDRRYSDLSPIDRVPCWHLQRDLYIMSDGRIGFCKQDVEGSYLQKNINDQSILDIWEKKREDFIKDYKRHYSSSPSCKICDEWYTFNF